MTTHLWRMLVGVVILNEGICHLASGQCARSGDTFESSDSLVPGSYVHSTVGYVNDHGAAAGCTGTAGADRMYLVAVPSGFKLTASTSGIGGFDPSISLVRGEDAFVVNAPCVASDDAGNSTTVNVVTTANSTWEMKVFFVIIDSSSATTGSYNLTIAVTALPPGESGELAQFVEPGTYAGQTTAGYSNEISGTAAGCSTANAGPDRCYSAIVPAGQTINFTATPVAGFDCSLSLIRGVDVVTLPRTCLANSNAGGAGVAELLSFTNSGSGAEVVVLVVDSTSSTGNGFSLQVTVAASAIGETAAKPEPVSAGVLAGQTTVGFENDVSSAGANCAPVTGRDRFYSISVPAGNRLTATVTPDIPGYDPNVSLLGLIHTTVCLAGSDAAGAGGADTVSYTNLSASAKTFIVRIDSATVSDPGGPFSLDLQIAPAPAGDIPRSAETIAGTVAGSTEIALGYANDFSPPVNWTGFANPGADRFYRITVAPGDQLVATLVPSAGFDGAVYLTPAFDTDLPMPFLLTGADTANAADSHTLMWTNSANAPRDVWLVVDSKNAGSGTYTLDAITAGGDTPEIQVRNGGLATDPALTDGQAAAVDFGDTLAGTGTTRTFRVENLGVASLTLSGISFSGGSFTAASSNLAPPVTIPCGGSATFIVTLTPSAVGADSLMMHLASNDVDEGSFDVPLSVNGVAPNPEIVLHNGALATDPELFDGQAGAVVFAATIAGSGVTRTFLVRNTGTTVMQVSSVSFSNTTGIGATSSVAAPFNVAAGSSTSFTVTLTPSAVGTFVPNMHIASTDADENPFDVPLTITASASTSEIVVHDGNSTSFPQIADGQVKPVDFGVTTSGVGITHTFLVRNTGNTTLTLSTVTFSGGGGTTPTTSFTTARNVAANATTTFTVTLSRAALGSDTLQMQIANNDTDENPFDVPLAFTAAAQLPGELPTGPVSLTDGGSVSGTTQNYVNHLNFTSACTGFTTPGRDRFYQITLAAGQQITVAIQPTSSSFDPAIYLIPASEAGSATPTCLDGDDAGSTTTVNIISYRNLGAVPEDVVLGIDSSASSAQGNFIMEIILDPPNAAAEIVVEQPSGTGLTDPSSTVVFDAAPVGAAGARVFTVRNTGSGNLTGLVISKDGLQSGDYAVSLPGATTLATNASTTFTVTFTPGAPGTRLAAIHIASNDADENPFDISLSGIGLTPIESWRQTFFGSPANSGNGANTADPDGEGSNLQEFAFGTNPIVSDAGTITRSGAVITQRGQPTTSVTNLPNGVDFRAMFGRRLDHVAAGLTYTVQFSADLTDWQDSTVTPTVVASDSEIEAVTVPYPFFLTDGRKARFFRVSISIVP